jgi:hypothetical protein
MVRNKEEVIKIIEKQIIQEGDSRFVCPLTVNQTLQLLLNQEINTIKTNSSINTFVIQSLFENIDFFPFDNKEILRENLNKYICRQKFSNSPKSNDTLFCHIDFFSIEEIRMKFSNDIKDLTIDLNNIIDLDINLLCSQFLGKKEFLISCNKNYKIVLLEFLKDKYLLDHNNYESLYTYRLLNDYFSYSFNKWLTDTIIAGTYGFDEFGNHIWWEGYIDNSLIKNMDIKDILPQKWISYSKGFQIYEHNTKSINNNET